MKNVLTLIAALTFMLICACSENHDSAKPQTDTAKSPDQTALSKAENTEYLFENLFFRRSGSCGAGYTYWSQRSEFIKNYQDSQGHDKYVQIYLFLERNHTYHVLFRHANMSIADDGTHDWTSDTSDEQVTGFWYVKEKKIVLSLIGEVDIQEHKYHLRFSAADFYFFTEISHSAPLPILDPCVTQTIPNE